MTDKHTDVANEISDLLCTGRFDPEAGAMAGLAEDPVAALLRKRYGTTEPLRPSALISGTRARRAAETIVAGIIAGGNELGLVFKSEGAGAFITAIAEAIENEYPPSSALISEATESITDQLKQQQPAWREAFVAIVADGLESFKLSIELGSINALRGPTDGHPEE